MTATRVVAEHEPVARVLPLLTVPHLDREFDYLVSAEQSDDAQPGVRVRVRFHGRLVDAILLERRSESDHAGKLGWLDRVVSPTRVLTPDVRRLVDAVAARYAGTRADVLRLALPPRHARAEKETRPAAADDFEPPAVDGSGWARYQRGERFLEALSQGRAARAVWQALPGEAWCTRLAEAAVAASGTGRGVLAVVPDQRDIDALSAECVKHIGAPRVIALSAELGPAERYRRWLAVLRGDATVVIGTRAAVFAPVANLGLVMVWDDGDDNLAEPRSPYPHAREVAMLRAHQLRCAAVIGGYARTAESQALVESRWAHDLVAARPVVRRACARISALDDSGYAQERDPAARSARLPMVALTAARDALKRGHSVLVQVPRRGYVPALACTRCRTVARCRHCTGPLALEGPGGPSNNVSPSCRWCGRVDADLHCVRCGSSAVRAVVVGARRTAEELGRALPGFPVVTSGGGEVHTTVTGPPSLVVCTPGAEPMTPNGYGAALLLDAWALLGRQDLRAAEDTLRKWMAAAALVRGHEEGGAVVVVADSTLPTVQALIRWDPVGHAAGELAARAEVGLPPQAHIAAIDGPAAAVAALVDTAELPDGAELLGPVDLPVGARRPAGISDGVEVVRMLVRVPRAAGLEMAAALRRGVATLSARRDAEPVRVQIDPLHVG
ncbi:primosomal protein N' [Mycobacteroides chelonae]|uniref:Probable replication restart protein PriA n=1 Tax=Mycobacteroides chelonae TaxID=1774 RepID=A0A1S1M2A1_MYCCH|nr:primosomal protein N' [Mycobacteroides chelonae]OHU76837.1 primosome assembly protein PriA [Mycobacteroides chelonae]QQG88212.1 primosomal protein N' [Mycobacteroides chelonae]QQG93029.1 primosomal protein N' [Mycobacteroides chelonae]